MVKMYAFFFIPTVTSTLFRPYFEWVGFVKFLLYMLFRSSRMLTIAEDFVPYLYGC